MAPGAAPERLTWAEARARVLAAAAPLDPVTEPLTACRGRALRVAIVAPHPLPPFRNSAMDGYAVRSADLANARPAWLPVVAVIPAGRVADRALDPGEAMRIMTGAALPAGADAVVPVEEAEREGLDGPAERVRLTGPVEPGRNVREAGLDVGTGETVLEPGRELSPHDLALAASLGCADLPVGPRLSAAVISTGDELLDPGEALRPGAIRDGNRPMLEALLEEAGCRVARSERVPDDPVRVAARIRGALDEADVVLTIGGASAGDFDPVRAALADLGGVALWRVAMRPGRPQAFGAPGDRLFFGLPGNPASVACTFEALVRPALRRRMGFAALGRPAVRARAAARVESRPGRVDFARVALERRADGWWAIPAGDPVSGHVAPQSRAHALLVVPEEAAALDAGDAAEAWVLRWPGEATAALGTGGPPPPDPAGHADRPGRPG